MNHYSPSAIGTIDRFCPRALDYNRAGAPSDSRVFDVGNAAHKLHSMAYHLRNRMEAVGLNPPMPWDEFASLAYDTLMVANDPIPPSAIDEALRLMRPFLEHIEFPPGALVECGTGFDRHWNVVQFDAAKSPTLRFRTVFDLMDEIVIGGDEDDEESEGLTFLRIRDYKTAWNADDSLLRGIQMCSYGVAAAIIIKVNGWDHIAGIRREIVAVRKGERAVYHDDLLLNDDGWEQIEQWKRQLTAIMDAADAMQGVAGHARDGTLLRPALVGENCNGCPYQTCCTAFKDVWTKGILGDYAEPETDKDRVLMLSVAEAIVDRVRPLLARACEAGEEIMLNDGRVFGYCEGEQREGAEYGPRVLFDAWKESGGDMDGFLAAMGAIGVTTAERMTGKIYPLVGVKKEDKPVVHEKREELLGKVLRLKATKKLGWVNKRAKIVPQASAVATADPDPTP